MTDLASPRRIQLSDIGLSKKQTDPGANENEDARNHQIATATCFT